MSRRGQKLALLGQHGGLGTSASRQQCADPAAPSTSAAAATAAAAAAGSSRVKSAPAAPSSSSTSPAGLGKNLVAVRRQRTPLAASRSPLNGTHAIRGATRGAAASLRNSIRANIFGGSSGRHNARKRPAPGASSGASGSSSNADLLLQQIRSRPRTSEDWARAMDRDVSMDSLGSAWSSVSENEALNGRGHLSHELGAICTNSNHSIASNNSSTSSKAHLGSASEGREDPPRRGRACVATPASGDAADGIDPSSRDELSREAASKLAPTALRMSREDFEAQDAALVDAADRERVAAVQGMSAKFREGFEAEWKTQRKRMDAACATTLRGLDEQLAEEKGREDLAKSTWEFQMRKAAKEAARLQDNLQSTREESELCEAQLRRFRSPPEELAAQADSDELQQLMATLLHTARLVRREKDARMNDQLSAMADVVKCVACQDNARSVVFLPCRHMCVCPACKKRLPRNECPMCRARISSCIDVMLNEGSIRS